MKKYTVVAGIIKNQEGKILLLDHKKTGLWTIPLGKVEEGEKTRQALIREMKEEVNIECEHFHAVNKYTYVYPQGETKTIIYSITQYSGELHNNEPHKHLDMKWLHLHEIDETNVTHATQAALEYLWELEVAKRDMVHSVFIDLGI